MKLTADAIGIENIDVLHAAALYLYGNIGNITMLFANDPQILDWMVWMVQTLVQI